jgi:putative transcriptional regulator
VAQSLRPNRRWWSDVTIYVTLDRILEERGMTLTELSERIDITLANLSILKTSKARAIRFSTLEALCRELDCQPGDLLSYED